MVCLNLKVDNIVRQDYINKNISSYLSIKNVLFCSWYRNSESIEKSKPKEKRKYIIIVWAEFYLQNYVRICVCY